MNVGCIPKKLMHYAALLGELRTDQVGAGWNVDPKGKHSWETMQQKVGNHIKVNHLILCSMLILIKGLNWGYKSQMIEKGVKYFNRFGYLEDAHTVRVTIPTKRPFLIV